MTDNLCPGCAVRPPWEHRCHSGACGCVECNPMEAPMAADEWARERAHTLTPRCRGAQCIGDDHVRYHSKACDDFTAALTEAAARERARINAMLEEPSEEMVAAMTTTFIQAEDAALRKGEEIDLVPVFRALAAKLDTGEPNA